MAAPHPSFEELSQKAARYNQEHIFRFWENLNSSQREGLLHQVAALDFDRMAALAARIVKKEAAPAAKLEPVQPIPIPRSEEEQRRARQMQEIGEQALRSHKVGAVLVAGGQGTRLGFDGPKGIFPIGPVSGKSLFQMHAEKIQALNRRYRTRIPWYIMTSETNDAATREFFTRHHFFELPPQDVFFFTQGMMPALDESGKLILDRPDHIFLSPDGHGGLFAALKKSGALEDMQRRGLELLFYFQVDNVLVKICDPVFLGYHIAEKAEMSVKVVPKRDAFEKVGVVGRIDGRLGVIEYSDLSDAEKQARDAEGKLLYNAGSIAIHVLSLPFMQRICDHAVELPWHIAHKKVPVVDEQGRTQAPDSPNAYKFERFIFDALQHAQHAVVMEVAREEEFSPVKNAEGEDSPATARRDLSRYFLRWLAAAGWELPQSETDRLPRVEISPLYALDAEEFRGKVGGKIHFQSGLYIE